MMGEYPFFRPLRGLVLCQGIFFLIWMFSFYYPEFPFGKYILLLIIILTLDIIFIVSVGSMSFLRIGTRLRFLWFLWLQKNFNQIQQGGN